MIDKRRMSDKHEDFLAELFGGRKTRGSGNQWRDPMDGKHNRKTEPYAFAWDGKATLAKSHTVTLDMIKKAREQSGGDEPMLALRWYANENLDVLEDWVLVSPHKLAEMREEIVRLRAQTEASHQEEPEDYLKIEASRTDSGRYLVRVNGEEVDTSVQIQNGTDRLPQIRLDKALVSNGEIWIDGVLRARVVGGKSEQVTS